MLMFKMLVLQKYHSLSNEATEFQVRNRINFQQFVDLELGDDVPTPKTRWDFRQLI